MQKKENVWAPKCGATRVTPSPKTSTQMAELVDRGIVIIGVATIIFILGEYAYTTHQTKDLQSQLAKVGAYRKKIDGKEGKYTHTGLVQFQSYCTWDLPDELGEYTLWVKQRLADMIANHQTIKDCVSYPKIIPQYSKSQDVSRYYVNHQPKNLIREIQQQLTHVHGFHDVIDGRVGKNTINQVAAFQENCLQADTYTLGKIDTRTRKALQNLVNSWKKIVDCKADM